MENTNDFNPMQAILNQLNQSDPQIRQLIEQQLMMNEKKKKEQVPVEEIVRRFRIQNRKLHDQGIALKQQLKQFKDEHDKMVVYLDHFLKLNNTLSAALGSCENCWGEDQNCDKCNGQGIPGWREVNKRLFNNYVQPCLEKLYGEGRTGPGGVQTLN